MNGRNQRHSENIETFFNRAHHESEMPDGPEMTGIEVQQGREQQNSNYERRGNNNYRMNQNYRQGGGGGGGNVTGNMERRGRRGSLDEGKQKSFTLKDEDFPTLEASRAHKQAPSPRVSSGNNQTPSTTGTPKVNDKNHNVSGR